MTAAIRRLSPLAWVGIVLLAGWLIWLPLSSDTTELRQHSQVIIAVAAVLGVNVATGYGGMISLGHGVFMGMGAFATAYYVDDLSMPWVVAIALGAATAGVSGIVVGLPALRIKGIHLALVTLGLAIAFQPIAKRFPTLTGGVSGKAVEARFDAPSWFGDTRLADAVWRYLFCIIMVAIAIVFTWNLIHSRPGRAMRAIRDNDTAALAGLAGGLQVVLVPFVSQETFTAQKSLVLYATAVIGGLGFIWGSVVGVAFREIVSWIGEQLATIDGWGVFSEFFALLDEEAFVFGFALVVLTYMFPRGLVGYTRRPGGRLATLVGALRRRYEVTAQS